MRTAYLALIVTLLATGASAQPAPATRPAAAPAAEYNKPSQGRTSDCGKLKDPEGLIPLRYADGTPRGYFVCG